MQGFSILWDNASIFHFTTIPLLALGIFLVLLLAAKNCKSGRNPHRLPLPPGPKGYPIVGNLFSAPWENQWLVYHEWAKTYGDIVYFEVLGQRFIVLDSLARTQDLFEKRAAKYSDRVGKPMLIDLMRSDFNFAQIPYGSWWRRHRREFHEHFRLNVVEKYQPIQAHETRVFLNRLLNSPNKFRDHIRIAFAAIIMKISYGITVKEQGDIYIQNAEESMRGLAEAGIPGTFLVDYLPFLKYVPNWFPGAGFKKKAELWRKVNKDVCEKPFEYVEDQMTKGNSTVSVATKLIGKLPEENGSKRAEEWEIARNVAAVAYIAGADTTVSTVQFFFLAMAMYPEVQKRAQAEIDRVVGTARLPGFNDQASLPYVCALAKELMRWKTVVPLVEHTVSEDDEYDGYFIPKGTVLFGNTWAILHDPEAYEDPFEFKPERFLKDGKLNPDVRDPDIAAFGYGRRICPGKHLSNASLYAIVSSVLAVYNITPPLDEHGRPIKLEAKITSGLLCYPLPFECDIKPRSPEAEALIRDAALISEL